MFRKLFNKNIISAASVLFGTKVLCNTKKNETYIWGSNNYEARPDALDQYHNFVPNLIQNLPDDLENLFFGEYYEAGITKKGQLYIWEKRIIDQKVEENNNNDKREGIKMIQQNVKLVRFTTGYIWTLDQTGKVFQFPINKKLDRLGNILQKQLGGKRQVQPLRGTISIQTGRDHVITLNQKGEVYAMGDDTLGQCGQPQLNRNTYPPLFQRRIKFPTKVKNLNDNIIQIATGNDHNIALDRSGNLYGWGSNANLQISHKDQFQKMYSPLICSYNPILISKNLSNTNIKKIVTGDQFTVIVGQNKQNGNGQVFACGGNIKGQLGIKQLKYFSDVQKIQKLSNVMKVKGVNKKIKVDQIQCGKNHCIALLNIGYIMEWGDNQYGQLGNQKRSPSFTPIILKDFTDKKIVGVFAGQNSTGVIIESQSQTN